MYESPKRKIIIKNKRFTKQANYAYKYINEVKRDDVTMFVFKKEKTYMGRM
jgi:hypothetical protein